jgi:TPP-dependent pyruvate/acetoin dehydrogenase alpha subunit
MPKAEREQAATNDPIKRFEDYLVSHDHLSAADILETKAEIEAVVEQSVQKATAADDPFPEDALKDVYV